MQTPPSIAFHGFEPTESIRELVDQQISRLEHHFPHLTTVRVVVDAPHQHHQQGAPYDVRIEVGVPGHEIAVNHQPGSRERKESVDTAIRDAFKAAIRRLEKDTAHRRGDVKHHESELLGAVSRLEPAEGYGFLKADDGRELWFSRNAVLDDAFDALEVGARVRYVESTEGLEGPMATTVQPLT